MSEQNETQSTLQDEAHAAPLPPYEPPAVVELSGVAAGQGITACNSGSGNIGNCTNGGAPGNSCDSGSGFN